MKKSIDWFNTNLEYLNLLYIIDVSEDEVKKMDGSDLVILRSKSLF
jgi:hypothetical protein